MFPEVKSRQHLFNFKNIDNNFLKNLNPIAKITNQKQQL